jgi:hypothetical protein
MTGYRIGRTAGVPLPKVYRELKRLRVSGLVARRDGGWVLDDEDVRQLLRKRFHVAWATDWFDEVARRAPEDRELAARLHALPAPKFSVGWKPRRPARFQRGAEKDRRLRNMGARISLHGDSPRV